MSYFAVMKSAGRPSVAVLAVLLGWMVQDGIGMCQTGVGTSDEPLAKVGGFVIREAAVERYLAKTVPDWPVENSLQAPLRRAALEHLISRQLVLSWLEQNGFNPTSAQIEWRIDEWRAELARVGRTLEEHWQQEELTPTEFQTEVRWELAWRAYLERELTEDRLKARFERSPGDFDGTERKVAQVLFEVETRAAIPEIVEQASQVRLNLQRGELAWSEAVRQYSQAPSRERNGELGWIRRHEPMPEEFSEVAFRLGEGEISSPVTSRFGVHLIKCLEIKPGKRQLGDVREEVHRTLMTEEFRRIAQMAKAAVDVWVRPDDERSQESNRKGEVE